MSEWVVSYGHREVHTHVSGARIEVGKVYQRNGGSTCELKEKCTISFHDGGTKTRVILRKNLAAKLEEIKPLAIAAHAAREKSISTRESAYDAATRLARFLGASFRKVSIAEGYGRGVTLRFVPREGETIEQMVERIVEC